MRPVVTESEHGHRRAALVDSLLADVFQGRVRAGTHLVTQDLAERFGVSHTPIREALITLAGIGIIDLLPNRGAIVRTVSAKEVREVCQVRRVLECEATRSACGQLPTTELEELAEALRTLQQTKKPTQQFIEQARALDSRLHDLIAESCGNAFLAREIARLNTLFRAFRDLAWQHDQAHNDYRRLTLEAQEHLAIIEALLAEDAAAAAHAMSRHIRSGVKYWTRALPTPRPPQGKPSPTSRTKRSRQ